MSFAAKDLTSEESLNQKPLAFPRRNVGGNASQGPYRETLSRVVSIKNLSDGVESSYIGQQIIHTGKTPCMIQCGALKPSWVAQLETLLFRFT